MYQVLLCQATSCHRHVIAHKANIILHSKRRWVDESDTKHYVWREMIRHRINVSWEVKKKVSKVNNHQLWRSFKIERISMNVWMENANDVIRNAAWKLIKREHVPFSSFNTITFYLTSHWVELVGGRNNSEIINYHSYLSKEGDEGWIVKS